MLPFLQLLTHLKCLKVVNDGDMYLWRELGVNSWPTFVLIGPNGKVLAQISGEGHRKVLVQHISLESIIVVYTFYFCIFRFCNANNIFWNPFFFQEYASYFLPIYFKDGKEPPASSNFWGCSWLTATIRRRCRPVAVHLVHDGREFRQDPVDGSLEVAGTLSPMVESGSDQRATVRGEGGSIGWWKRRIEERTMAERTESVRSPQEALNETTQIPRGRHYIYKKKVLGNFQRNWRRGS